MRQDRCSTRRELLRDALTLGVSAAAAGAVAGCGTLQEKAQLVTGPAPPDYTPPPPDAPAALTRGLQRLTWGPRPGDIAHAQQIGLHAFIEEQLAAPNPPAPAASGGRLLPDLRDILPPGSGRNALTLEEDPAVAWRVNALEVQQMQEDAPELLYSTSDAQLLLETQQAALLRAVYSRYQLREVMADFWTNHFNIYALKNDGRALIPVDTERVLRPHLLGRFREMLFASAHSPAMLSYLDNHQNRRGVANENYARELLELHTLGVKSGYTQKDIQETARCFTGWTVQGGFLRGQFVYNDALHDPGAKNIPFLGLTLAPGGGRNDAECVLECLATHQATALFLAQKLCRRFLGEAPETIVQKAATAYRKQDTDIRAMLRPILLDGLAAGMGVKPLVRRPLDLTVAALRALNADTDCGEGLQRHLASMGQPLYQWPMPDGFPEKPSAWAGSFLPRWQFLRALTANAIPGTRIDLQAPLSAAGAHDDAAVLETLMELLTGRPRSAPELTALREPLRQHFARARAAGLPEAPLCAEAAALILAAPLCQWR